MTHIEHLWKWWRWECLISDCKRRRYRYGLCVPHYEHWKYIDGAEYR